MKKAIFFVLIYSFTFYSCKKEDKTPTSGTITLSSQKSGDQNFYVKGFSLEKADFVEFSLGSVSQVPDWVLEEIIDIQGNPIGANLTTNPQNTQAFFINAIYNTIDEAKAAFSAYHNVSTTSFVSKALNVKPFSILTYKDRNNKYAKILIEAVEKKSSESTSHYEITIQWVYQPDGTKSFNE